MGSSSGLWHIKNLNVGIFCGQLNKEHFGASSSGQLVLGFSNSLGGHFSNAKCLKVEETGIKSCLGHGK